jgi:hypothetical protein
MTLALPDSMVSQEISRDWRAVALHANKVSPRPVDVINTLTRRLQVF